MCQHCMHRREFGALAAAGVVGSMAGLSSAVAADPLTVEAWDPDQPPVVTGRPLRIQPVLAYQVMTPRPKTSWRSWSDIINPCLPMCRSQQDVEIQGAWKRLIPEARNSHWMMAYGDYLREVGYAAHKIGLTWDNVSDVDA
jgi:hypothetical protein